MKTGGRMKTKEFIKRVEGLEFEVENGKEYYYIKDIDGELIASINKLITFQICTNFNAWDELCDDLKKQLFDIISKYTKTPVDEREEEKKLYLRHRYFRFDNGSSKYLGMDLLKYKPDLYSKITYRWVKNQFTEKEIDEIKEKFNTDLGDFKKIEVEE